MIVHYIVQAYYTRDWYLVLIVPWHQFDTRGVIFIAIWWYILNNIGAIFSAIVPVLDTPVYTLSST